MNTFQIKNILDNYKPLKGVFKNVYPSNVITKTRKVPYCFVANTMRKGTVGQHWVACYSESRDMVDYFDSLADDPPPDIQHFLDQFHRVNKNNIALQSFFSDSCGYFCIYFLIKRQKNGFNQLVKKLYSLPINEREKMVKGFVQSLSTHR